MKIGDAGEAFFVFETEEDVPDSLVTSPILEATKPGETNAHPSETGRFGAPASPPPKDQEPEFLDLDATTDARRDTREDVKAQEEISEEVEEAKLLGQKTESNLNPLVAPRPTVTNEPPRLQPRHTIAPTLLRV